MSKKNKNKFRKRIQAEIAQQLNQTNLQPSVVKSPVIVSSTPQNVPAEVTKPVASQAVDNNVFIKKDLKKSGLIIGTILVLIVALFLLDNHYGFLIKTSSHVFKFLHIQV